MEMMVGWVSVDAAVDSSAEHTQAGPDSHTVLHIHILFFIFATSKTHTYTNKFTNKQADTKYFMFREGIKKKSTFFRKKS